MRPRIMQLSKDLTSNAYEASNTYRLRISVIGVLKALCRSMDGAYTSLSQAANTGSTSTVILV
jgi:hypothetical protein